MFKVEIEGRFCKACGYCISACPKKVIEFGEDVNPMGYYFAKAVRTEDCIGCCSCATICPDAAISVYKRED
mgnify:CR=1 FL=1